MTRQPKAPDAAQPRGCYTDALYTIHGLYRNAFSRAPGMVERTDPEDAAAVQRAADRLEADLQSLQGHHVHEDDLYWQLMLEREPSCAPVVERMKQQHQAIHHSAQELLGLTASWRRQPQDKQALLDALHAFEQQVFAHLEDEEQHAKPVAGRVLIQAEWDMAHERGRREAPRKGLLVSLGYLLQGAPTAKLRDEFWRGVPAPIRLLYQLSAKKKFEQEWEALYGEKPA